MEKVYIATDGEYSDYHICAVFLDKESAEIFKQRFGVTIEEWKIGDNYIKILQKKEIWFVRMKRNGDVIDVEMRTDEFSFRQAFEDFYIFDIGGNLYTVVFAEDEKTAIKIVNDKRVELIASEKWREDNIKH